MFVDVNKCGTSVSPGRMGSRVIPFLPTEIHPFPFAAEHFSLQCSYDAAGLENIRNVNQSLSFTGIMFILH